MKIPILVWKIIFICIQIFDFGILVGAMDNDEWFRQKLKYYQYSYTYRGKLLKSGKDLNFCDVDDSFKYCYDECIDICDNYPSGQDECKDTCKRFKAWYDGGAVYVALDTIASIITVIIVVLIVLSFFKIQKLNKIANVFITAVLMIVVLFLHLLAFVIYTGIVKLEYEDCTHNSDYDGIKSVCGEAGAQLALFLLIWLLAIVPFYFYISIKIRIKENNEIANVEHHEMHPIKTEHDEEVKVNVKSQIRST